MIEQRGDEYQGSRYAKALYVDLPKTGKTSFIVAQCLGLFPGQKYGGIVSRPEDLHILAFDASALGGLDQFLVKTCGGTKEALRYRVYNMQDDARRVEEIKDEYSTAFYMLVKETLTKVVERINGAKGVSAILFASLTGMAYPLERSIMGPTSEGEPARGDPDKWKILARQLHDIQNFAQIDSHHCLWEAHIDKPPPPPMKKRGEEQDGQKETIRVSGEAGRNWGYNVEQVFHLRRMFGDGENGKCDPVYLDTRPTIEFIAGGRGFTERLRPKEYDMTLAFHKLGLRIGRWGSKSSK